MLVKLYLWAKKIHRLLVLIISALTLVMAGTGLLMKYPKLAGGAIDLGLMRYLHNQLSVYFTGVLVLMALTGLYMYVFPVLNKPKQPPTQIN
jgi:hypothetical protein